MIMNKLVVWLAVCLGGISSALYADTGKPVVWIYTDMSDKSIPGPNKEGTVNDPDDISAMPGICYWLIVLIRGVSWWPVLIGNNMLRPVIKQSGHSIIWAKPMRPMW